MRLRIGRLAQQLDPLGGLFFLENAGHGLVGLAACDDIVGGGRIDTLDVLADLAIKPRAGLLAKRTLGEQAGKQRRRGIDRLKRIALERVLHGLDHMAEGVQAHHIGGAKGAGFGAAHLLAGQVIDHINRQAELRGFHDSGQQTEDAHAVADEVGCVAGAHHALAERGREEGLKPIEDGRIGGRSRNQFDQMHVARRIEEMHTAKALLERVIEAFGQRGDREPRGVGGEDRIRRQERRDLAIEIVLPVHALGDRLDHQVTAAQCLEMLVVVGRLDEGGKLGRAQRRRIELFQPLDRLDRNRALVALFGRQIEQHHLDPGIDQMGRDLRAHHPGAQHRHFANDESAHDFS